MSDGGPAPTPPLVLATRSAGKIRELRALCAERGIAVVTLEELGIAESPAEDALEVFETFEANARAKARYFAAMLPGRWVLAEDSGLVVDALGGAPGVRSKRWTGSTATGAALDAENNAALQRALAGVEDRRARYECVAVLVHGDAEWVHAGRVEGRITQAPRGVNGFGYDPYFESVELGCTFAEASPAAKAEVSHRARAVRGLLEHSVRS
ncbi:non-canonical purine NTP pyrophosphatase [Pseudogemmatithrix spongiicola]|uniref:dITP/XTP pyrophosphatase n=1 Tax=Pseudogemmatithrix spongiicola TaxID=3062599 RepID=A0AA49JU80_9BACT|nr:non-canonical purine NTP pyrophosphatase [Gemmatimonadaceae bacterium 'strain 138']WKW15036.1 non-canonical purine NTP pyrophosphatase [Gemmatimonadaceae bacterium 'strain 318']